MPTPSFSRTSCSRKIFLVALIAFFLYPLSASAQCTSKWSGGTSGNWGTAGNWTPSGVPTSSSNTCINTANSSVTTSGTYATTDDLTLALSSDTLTVGAGGLTIAAGGTISNAGTIVISPISSSGLVLSGATTLTGGGNLMLLEGSASLILAGASGATLTNVNNTISGAGYIGYEFGLSSPPGLSFVNEAGGTVDATATPDYPMLVIQPGTGSGIGTTNLGLMEASSGGTLSLEDTVTNTGGTIKALAGGTVELNATDLIGGTLTSVGTGVISDFGALLDGTSGHPITITSGSTLQVLAPATEANFNNSLTLQGSIINNGTILLESGCNVTDGCNAAYLYIVGPVTLSGTGTVTMSNFAANFIQGTGTLTNQQTIQGQGTIGNATSMSLVNSGIINANNADLIVINPGGGTTNTGTLEATAGGELNLDTYAVTNTGGTILATGYDAATNTYSSIYLSGASITGGTLTTNSGGAIYGENNSTLTNLTISAGSTLIVPVGGDTLSLGAGTITNNGTINLMTSGNPSALNILGGVTLAGTGEVIMTANSSIQGTGTLTNQNTIQGSGTIGTADTLTLINSGTINANSSAYPLSISVISLTNTGTLEATAGGTLEIGAVANTGGTILASGTGSSVLLEGTISGGTLTSNSGGVLDMEGGTTLKTLTISTGSTVDVLNNSTLLLQGTITNKGTINLLSTGDVTFLEISGDVTLAGTGKVVLPSDGESIIDGGGTLTNQNTIEGGGYISTNVFINTGTIIADNSSHILMIQTVGSFSNSSGTKNGTLKVNAGDTLFIVSDLSNFSGTTLTGGIYSVSGTLEFNAGANGIVTNAVTITLTGATSEILNGSTSKDALTKFAVNASDGSFTLAGNRNFTTAGAFSNAGELTISKGSKFTVGGTNSYTQTAGTTTVSGNLVVSSPGAMKVSGGSVFGIGTITGNIDLTGGLLSPGAATKKAGELTVSGNYTESGTGVLNIDLDGTTAGTNYDVLNISGKAALGGTLNVDALGSFKPTVGQQYDILDYGTETGKFTSVDCTFSNGDGCTITYDSTGAVLTITAPAAPASPSLTSVNGTPARWTRSTSLLGSGAGIAHEPSAILTPAETCSGPRIFASFACLTRAFSGVAASTASAFHGNAGSERAIATFGTLHNNVAAASTSGSATRYNASPTRDSRAVSAAFARAPIRLRLSTVRRGQHNGLPLVGSLLRCKCSAELQLGILVALLVSLSSRTQPRVFRGWW
jgi:hypothetical protein